MTETALKEKFDTALDSVAQLIEQCYQAWIESRKIEFGSDYKEIQSILVCGMGGSSLPAHIISSAFQTTVPLLINESYDLPEWVNKNTLVILSSYSGNTEETISCFEQAKDRGVLMTGITGGGKLAQLFVQNKIPFYLFNPIHNPSNLPRFGIGYGIFGQLGILTKLNLLKDLSEEELDRDFNNSLKHLSLNLDKISNTAKEQTNNLNADVVVLFSSGHLKGNGHTFANQINETSKVMSFFTELPEADHNLIEGFRKSNLKAEALFIESINYHPQVQDRFTVTREIINLNGYQNSVYKVDKGPLLQEMLETLLFSSYFSVKLAQKNNSDPLAIPSIDSIKKKLSLTKLK